MQEIMSLEVQPIAAAGQEGDLVIFHNPGLLHRSYTYSDTACRVMHRTTFEGHRGNRGARNSWGGGLAGA